MVPSMDQRRRHTAPSSARWSPSSITSARVRRRHQPDGFRESIHSTACLRHAARMRGWPEADDGRMSGQDDTGWRNRGTPSTETIRDIRPSESPQLPGTVTGVRESSGMRWSPPSPRLYGDCPRPCQRCAGRALTKRRRAFPGFVWSVANIPDHVPPSGIDHKCLILWEIKDN